MMESDKASWLAVFKGRFVYGLVFLFPIAGVSVSHWFSGIFTVLVLVSLWDLLRTKLKGVTLAALFRDEKIWLWLCAAFFVVTIAAAWVNGWERAQNRTLGVDIRYLLVVPLFLMLRHYRYAWRYLLAGAVVAAAVLGGQAYYDIHVLGLARAQGIYSPNLMGPVAALVAVWLMAGWSSLRPVRWLLPGLIVTALYAVVMSGSRGAYLGLVIMLLAWAVLYVKGRWKGLVLLLVFVVPLAIHHFVPSVQQRVSGVADEIHQYFDELEKGNHFAAGSTAVRLEMWRAGWLVFQDAPLLGVGPGNYDKAVQALVDKGEVAVEAAHHSHAHNAYIDIMVSRGLLGLALFMGMLFYPLYLFLKTFRQSPETAILGILHIVGLAVFSLTDASTFIKGNFVSIFLLGLTIFYSGHLTRVKQVVE